jgi:hypothetical protein
VPSAARLLNEVETLDLAAIARSLPAGWVVAIEPPHGQLTIRPRSYLEVAVRCHVADAELGVIYRMDSRQGRRVPSRARHARRSSDAAVPQGAS